MITAPQMRSARAHLNLSQDQVAEFTGIGKQTLSNAERESHTLSGKNADLLQLFYETKGLEFLANNGVRETQTGIIKYQGAVEFQKFYDDIYETARKYGGDICLFNGVSELVRKWLSDEHLAIQVKRMESIKDKFHFRVIVEEGDHAYMGSTYCEYKWFPKELFNDKTFYVYGSKVAFVNFDNDDVVVTVIDQSETAATQNILFDLAWNHIAKDTPDE